MGASYQRRFVCEKLGTGRPTQLKWEWLSHQQRHPVCSSIFPDWIQAKALKLCSKHNKIYSTPPNDLHLDSADGQLALLPQRCLLIRKAGPRGSSWIRFCSYQRMETTKRLFLRCLDSQKLSCQQHRPSFCSGYHFSGSFFRLSTKKRGFGHTLTL